MSLSDDLILIDGIYYLKAVRTREFIKELKVILKMNGELTEMMIDSEAGEKLI